MAALAHYIGVFSHLHRNVHAARGPAPHKPILLLAILHEIDAGRITENLIAITPELVASFHAHWKVLASSSTSRNPRMTYPFRYLVGDGFWELVRHGQRVQIPTRHEPTLNQLAGLCDGGRFAEDLWLLLLDSQTRGILRCHLQTTYFPGNEIELVDASTMDFISIQAEKLKRQAQAKFREHRVAESSDGYFVRHRLFPIVVKELYLHSCCVCGLTARLGNNNLIDGAHILPFADFHNDDPRNGLALCKNHHWGFDTGAWSVDDDLRIRRSPKLSADASFLGTASIITLPEDQSCRPDPTALRWHREKIFQVG